mmetsp:Transcript_12964/g.32726  ORF Transcript_12964/g.32726 Transcript_12964/m.32726 type:complete len:243 (-) Transcript_12964:818-1546(-)
MDDGRNSSIPVVDGVSIIICLLDDLPVAPFGKRLVPECPHVVDNPEALILNQNSPNILCISELVAVIQIIVKALIGSKDDGFRFVRLCHLGSEIGVNRRLFSHGRTAANGGFVLEGIGHCLPIGEYQPPAVVLADSQARGVGVFPEKDERPAFIGCFSPWNPDKGRFLKDCISRINQQYPTGGVIVFGPYPIQFVAYRLRGSTVPSIQEWGNLSRLLVLATKHVVALANPHPALVALLDFSL